MKNGKLEESCSCFVLGSSLQLLLSVYFYFIFLFLFLYVVF